MGWPSRTSEVSAGEKDELVGVWKKEAVPAVVSAGSKSTARYIELEAGDRPIVGIRVRPELRHCHHGGRHLFGHGVHPRPVEEVGHQVSSGGEIVGAR